MTINKTLIVDVYHGDPITDLEKLKATGVIGIIHKATQGGAIWDQAYANRRKWALSLGLLWGAYHFFDFTASPSVQADHFLSVAAPDQKTLVALDWENIGNQEPSAHLARLFLEEVESKIGRKAVIYSGNVAKEQIQGKDEYFGSHRLWLCQYSTEWKIQESWQYPWLWQNSEKGRLPGITGNVDTDTIVDPMTVERLTAEWAS